jgi:hypothetical protein
MGGISERNGLHLAPFTGDDPLAAMPPARWPSHRCDHAGCAGVPVR